VNLQKEHNQTGGIFGAITPTVCTK